MSPLQLFRISPEGGKGSLVRVCERPSVWCTGFCTPSTCLTPDLQRSGLRCHPDVGTWALLANGSQDAPGGLASIGAHRGSPWQAPPFPAGVAGLAYSTI